MADWHVHVEEVLPHVVKIETSSGSGTGFLAARQDDNVVIATAFHVVVEADRWRSPIRITNNNASVCTVTHDRRSMALDGSLDSAAILVHPSMLSGFPELPDHPLDVVPHDRSVKAGVEVGWLGCTFGHTSPLFASGNVAGYHEGMQAYFVDGVVIHGASGGPAFYYSEQREAVNIMGCVTEYWPDRGRSGEALPGIGIVRDVTKVLTNIRGVFERTQPD